MADLKMNMSLDDIIKTTKDNTGLNKNQGYIKKTGFIRNNYANSSQSDKVDVKEKRFFNENRQKFDKRDYNNRSYRNNFNSNNRNRHEDIHKNKVYKICLL